MFQVEEVKIAEIKLDEVHRRDLGDLEGLKFSIQQYGVLQPILLNENYELLAGERRLRSCMELEHSHIYARILPGLTADDCMMIEFIENHDRKDFTWIEELELKAKLHAYWKEVNGQWGYRETAAKFGVSLGGLSSDLALAEAIKHFPELREMKTKGKAREGYKKLQSSAEAIMAVNSLSAEDQEKIAQMMDRTNEVVSAKHAANAADAIPMAKHGDQAPQDTFGKSEELTAAASGSAPPIEEPDGLPEFTYRTCPFEEFLPQIPENIVGFAELDPPYAINYEYTYYDDTPTDADWTLEQLEDGMTFILKQLQRVMLDNSWVLCWTGYEHVLWIQDLAKSLGFHIQHPGIWYKPNGGRTQTPSVTMKSCYETFLLFRKGKAMFSTPSFSNVVSCETISGDRMHKWEKPIDLYRKFFQALAKPNSYFLSPFAGSGNSMITSTFFDMTPLGCDKSNKYFYQFYRNLTNYYTEL